MNEVNRQPPKSPQDWELVLFSCKFCGRLWRFEDATEAKNSTEMWGLGEFYYIRQCHCGNKMAVECMPFRTDEEAFFRYVYKLEQEVQVLTKKVEVIEAKS